MLKIMALLLSVCYGVRICSRLLDLRLNPAPDDFRGGGLRQRFGLPPTLLGFKSGLGTEKAVRDSWYPPEYAEVVFHRLKCIVSDEAQHSEYFR